MRVLSLAAHKLPLRPWLLINFCRHMDKSPCVLRGPNLSAPETDAISCFSYSTMVLRKPTPVESSASASSLSGLPRHLDKLDSGSDEVPTSPQMTRDQSQSPHPQSNSSADAQINSSYSLFVDARSGGPYTKEEASNTEQLPSAGPASEASRGVDFLYPELPGNLMPAPSTSGKATPRSSLDSEGSREFGEEVLSKQGECNTIPELPQPSRSRHVATLVPESAATSIQPQTSPPQSSEGRSIELFHSNNPFRQATSSNAVRPEPRPSFNGDLESRNEKGEAGLDCKKPKHGPALFGLHD